MTNKFSSRKPSFRIPFTASKLVKKMFFYVQTTGVVYTEWDYFVQREDYDSILICYVFGGEGTLEYRNNTFNLEKGSVFIIDCLDKHVYKSYKNNPLKLMFMHFNGPLSREYVKLILKHHPCVFEFSSDSRIVYDLGSIIKLMKKKALAQNVRWT